MEQTRPGQAPPGGEDGENMKRNKRKNLAKWTSALRSGNYKQGRHRLAKFAPDGTIYYCCFGVACELYIKEHPEFPRIQGYRQSIQFGPDRDLYLPPKEVAEWLGLDEAAIAILVNMNDSGERFTKIADKIEKLASAHREQARPLAATA
jgi:hypothetical protein